MSIQCVGRTTLGAARRTTLGALGADQPFDWFAFGTITQADGNTINGVATWNPDAGEWQNFGAGLPSASANDLLFADGVYWCTSGAGLYRRTAAASWSAASPPAIWSQPRVFNNRLHVVAGVGPSTYGIYYYDESAASWVKAVAGFPTALGITGYGFADGRCYANSQSKFHEHDGASWSDVTDTNWSQFINSFVRADGVLPETATARWDKNGNGRLNFSDVNVCVYDPASGVMSLWDDTILVGASFDRWEWAGFISPDVIQWGNKRLLERAFRYSDFSTLDSYGIARREAGGMQWELKTSEASGWRAASGGSVLLIANQSNNAWNGAVQNEWQVHKWDGSLLSQVGDIQAGLPIDVAGIPRQ